jgi:hypothetical protein
MIPLALSLLFKISLAIQGLCGSIRILGCFSVSVKNDIGRILLGVELNLYIALGSMNILTIYFQSINMGYLIIYLYHQFLSSIFYGF